MTSRQWILAGAVAVAAIWLWRRRSCGCGDSVSTSSTDSVQSTTGSIGAPAVQIDLSSVTAALHALQVAKNLKTAVVSAPAGTTELVSGIGGQRVRVLAFSVMGSGAIDASFTSAGRAIWSIALEAVAGKSGANLATALPAYLFAGDVGADLSVQLSAPATVSITYWQEA